VLRQRKVVQYRGSIATVMYHNHSLTLAGNEVLLNDVQVNAALQLDQQNSKRFTYATVRHNAQREMQGTLHDANSR
jgi:hypothetical protein